MSAGVETEKIGWNISDIKKAIAEATVNTHKLCKVNMPACRLHP